MTHRKYGTLISFNLGDVWKRSDRSCFAFTITFVYQDQTIKKQYSNFKTKKEAKEKLAVIASQLYSGQFVFQDDIKIKDFFKIWLTESVCKEKQNRAATYVSYAYYCNKFFAPSFGNKKVHELSQSDIIDWIHSPMMKNYNITTMKSALSALKIALRYAKREGYVSSNIIEKFGWPKNFSNEGRPLTREPKTLLLEQSTLLLSNAKQFSANPNNSNIYPYVLFALTLGLRKGEIRGLKYSDFNFFESKVNIVRQLSFAKRMDMSIDDTNPERNTDAPLKTKSSGRELHVPKFVMQEIAKMRESYLENKEKYPDFKDDDYVFCSDKGIPRSNAFGYVSYKELLVELNLPDISIHDLRRTHATLLSEMRVSEKAISMALGHATTRVTAEKYIVFPKAISRESLVLNNITGELTKDLDDTSYTAVALDFSLAKYRENDDASETTLQTTEDVF